MPVKVLSPTLQRASSRKSPYRHFISISSFGQIIPRKGIEQTLEALSGLKAEFDFHFTLVGAESPYWDVRELIIRHGLTEHVDITGHVTLEDFDRYIAASDIVINYVSIPLAKLPPACAARWPSVFPQSFRT